MSCKSKSSSSIRNSSDTRILALAAFWQSQLNVLCSTCEFFAGADYAWDPADTPCSLVTLQPFCPGGLARLCLNVHSDIIQGAAFALSQGFEDSVRRLGYIVVHTACWPVPHLHTENGLSLNWKMARGLIGTPHELYAWPVPHRIMQSKRSQMGRQLAGFACCIPPIHAKLIISPRRICKVKQEIKRNIVESDYNTNGQPKHDITPMIYHLQYAGQVWKLRDQALQLEFQYHLELERGPSLSQRLLSCFSSSPRKRSHSKSAADNAIGPRSALLTYAPSLPMFAVAQHLIQSQKVPRTAALAEAAHLLVRHDRLFALSLFFGVPLMDRTQTLLGSLRCAMVVRPTPSNAQIEDFCRRFCVPRRQGERRESTPLLKSCRTTLRTILLQRAESLWQMTEENDDTRTNGTNSTINGSVYVAWSGGIDSTTVLVAMLLQAQAKPQRRSRLIVLLDDESVVENPLFYSTWIKDQLSTEFRKDKPLSWHEERIRECTSKSVMNSILVTGELGDQLFGSDRCKAAFSGDLPVVALPSDTARDAPAPPPPEYEGVFADHGLHAPWQDTVLPAMASVGLIALGGFAEWKEWIAPQLAVAPFQIVSTYDFLWWLNFSMKWQNVSLRFLHDGGAPLLEQGIRYGMKGSCAMRHFFDDANLECWSCVPDFHQYKFPDLTNFTTYKEPLKFFIREYDGDENFYNHKIKTPSLCFGAPEEPNSLVNCFHGALVELMTQPEHPVDTRRQESTKIDQASTPRLLSSGPCGLSTPFLEDDGDGYSLVQLLECHIISALRGYPDGLDDAIHVDPWPDSILPTSPFNLAPFFADSDERQRRIFNPVSRITLTWKCAALLTPKILNSRSFLDLGACLGASTHWALCMGASSAIAVEAQESFCKRGAEMLQKAQGLGCWPSIGKHAADMGRAPFQFVCSGVREYLEQCSNTSHDVILAAGLLHCFLDPISILLEMTRVASHAVLIEMTHPQAYRDGHLQDPDETDVETEIRTFDSLGLSVRSLKRRLEEGGLLQVAPNAHVNMAGNDASFAGLAVIPSRSAVEQLMKAQGFHVRRVLLKEHPTAIEDVLTYTGPHKYRALSTRYFLQCVRITEAGTASARSLESLVRTNDHSVASPWSKSQSWYSFDSARSIPVMLDKGGDDLALRPCKGPSPPAVSDDIPCSQQKTADPPAPDSRHDDPPKKWEFDSTIATRFQHEARCHIPDYEDLIDCSIELLEHDLTTRLDEKRMVKVVDVGCATGYTLLRLLDRGFQNVHGVDLSRPMIEKARENLMQSECFSKNKVGLHVSENPLELPSSLCGDGVGGLMGAVFINWTLHFVVNADDRKKFLGNVSKCMEPGALLVLTEKTSQNALTKRAYYEFKKGNGITEQEIAVKEAQLQGVLEPFTVDWYLNALAQCGFTDVSVFRARYGFVTFLARKKQMSQGPPSFPTTTRERFRAWPNFAEGADQVHYETKQVDAPFAMCAWGGDIDGEGDSATSPVSWSENLEGRSVYGYVDRGTAQLLILHTNRSFTLQAGMYFSCSDYHVNILGGSGVLFLVPSQRALFAIGGPVEDGNGRLPYIDGCTDTLLLAPAVIGAPCLNHLHFPAGVVQTPHTHPSGRSGVVIRGQGTCVCGDIRHPLEPGTAFVIPTNVVHAFETTHGQELDVIAFHPDSDFGPSADNHPMINRTIVNGISASKIQSIKTLRF